MSIAYENTVRPESDPRSETFRVCYDADCSCAVSTILVLSLSSLTGDEPTEMLPLNNAVDPDVLECHVRGRTRGADLSFEFHNYHVMVSDDGRITFSPLDARDTEIEGD